MSHRPLTILCMATYEKGQEFMRECKRQGCVVLLITVEKLRDADWPHESLDEIFYIPNAVKVEDVIHSVSYLARTHKIDRIVALDEFDMETAAALREHLRLSGMGLTTIRYFRDKLAMRTQAHEHGVLVPPFVRVVYHPDLAEYMERVPGPWVLKPRTEAAAIGIKKINHPDELWPTLEELGDRQSYFLLEKFVPGDVYHVDAVVYGGEVVFHTVSKYRQPPMRVAHEGGVFITGMLARESEEAQQLTEANTKVLKALGLPRGVTHTEFIRAHSDGQFYFLECAARVGGAYISDMIETATGISLWREWAKIEIAAGKQPYELPPVSPDYGGIVLSLAKQDDPDTSAYNDPEVAVRLKKHHHAGLILRSPSADRIRELQEAYAPRFVQDFVAVEPPRDQAQ